MSDPIHHECGLVLIRLRRPLRYYLEKYGTAAWGLEKLHLLMVKQRNRGQDGAGVACVKFEMPMGEPYIFRRRSAKPDAVSALFDQIHRDLRHISRRKYADYSDAELKQRFDFLGELYLGHLRYGTFSGAGVSTCHPYVRHNTAAARTLVLAGNFNLTNADEIFTKLISYGLRPVGLSDTLTILEKIGHFLDRENDDLLRQITREQPEATGPQLAAQINRRLEIASVLRRASKDWDGGYAFVGLLGNGDAFVMRDPNGIRPVYYYLDDEIVAVASERAALTTVFDVEPEEIRFIGRGNALSIRHDGEIAEHEVKEPGELRQCSFERIYFSRGNDKAIYSERKALGRHLAPRVLETVEFDLERTAFSYIPNTAETAFLGLIEEVERIVRMRHAEEIWRLHQSGDLTRERLERLTNGIPRVEKAAHKDQKIRTFIAQDATRGHLVSHVYDITRGVLKPDDTLIVLDDSIVRGTTLRESIITMLARLNPKRIVIVSSAPPIRYPDCYGIDMSELGKFVAFQAAIEIRRRRGEQSLLDEVYQACRREHGLPTRAKRVTAQHGLEAHAPGLEGDAPGLEGDAPFENHVRRIYDGIPLDELSDMVAQIIRPRDIAWRGELKVVYQSIDGLRASLPEHTGDWYFTGRYPTPGGYKVLNTAYINFYEKRAGRSYE